MHAGRLLIMLEIIHRPKIFPCSEFRINEEDKANAPHEKDNSQLYLLSLLFDHYTYRTSISRSSDHFILSA